MFYKPPTNRSYFSKQYTIFHKSSLIYCFVNQQLFKGKYSDVEFTERKDQWYFQIQWQQIYPCLCKVLNCFLLFSQFIWQHYISLYGDICLQINKTKPFFFLIEKEMFNFPFCRREKPLAMYLFADDKTLVHKLEMSTSSGGYVVNDVLMHAGGEWSNDIGILKRRLHFRRHFVFYSIWRQFGVNRLSSEFHRTELEGAACTKSTVFLAVSGAMSFFYKRGGQI